MKISVIIPTYNEADFIVETVGKVQDRAKQFVHEIIIADGGSSDNTLELAGQTGSKVLKSPRKGRAAQMNHGAHHAKGEILYFLHADTLPPPAFDKAILQAIKTGHDAGCFQLAFDDQHGLLQLYAHFTYFDIDAFRFGDQSLFITRDAFRKLGGFREDHFVMEDQEIVRRIKQSHSFTVLEDSVMTSARKYRMHGVLKLQLIFTLIFMLYYLGVGQKKLAFLYRNLVDSSVKTFK